MTKSMTSLNDILNIIRRGENFLVLPHILPDGDTIGSSLGLYWFLKKLGKNPYILLDGHIPNNLLFLPGASNIMLTWDEDIKVDTVIFIDASDLDRLGPNALFVEKVENSINIDHHITNTYYASCNYVSEDAAATGEIIYHLIKSSEVDIDEHIATCLYTAVTTDTGSFKYDNTKPHTHRIAAELLEYGVDVNQVTTEIYQNKPVCQVKLLSAALNTLTMESSGKLAVILVTKEMLSKSQASVLDADGIIEFGRDIQGVEVAVLLKEVEEKEIKVGFRSKYDIDVSKIAKDFGGGGHKKASGCTIYDSIMNAKQAVIQAVTAYL